jgi:GTPase Era involved in 16S rRNA processing
MINAQKYIEKTYPDKFNTKEIHVRNHSLEGDLDLREYKNLEKLDLFYNGVSSLNLKGLNKLWWVWIGNNNLTSLDLQSQERSLTHLHIGDNNFPEQDLSAFSKLTNLQDFRPGNWEINKFSVSNYNKFHGSLKPLKDMHNLKSLNIENTNISEGLEHLSGNIDNFGYGDASEAVRFETKGSNKFKEQLSDYKNNFQTWKLLNRIKEEAPKEQVGKISICFGNFGRSEISNGNDISRTRNILLVGRTGSGKSTLANVLVNKNDKFEEVFKEGAGSTSQTRNIQERSMELNDVEYRVIDTMGIADTNTDLNDKKALVKIKDEIINTLKSEGLVKFFFVFKDKFSPEDVKAYEDLQSIFDSNQNIVRIITLIRTRAAIFKNEEKCKKDKATMIQEGGKVEKIISSCKKLIHVDNPSLDVDDEDDLAPNLKKRECSRQKLLDYLSGCEKIYQSKSPSSQLSYITYNQGIHAGGNVKVKGDFLMDQAKIEIPPKS